MVLPILAVKDMTASVDFYCNKLGWNNVFDMPTEGGGISFAMVSLREGVMFGLSRMDAPEPKGQGVALMCYIADDSDIDAYYTECMGRGASIAMEIKDEYWGDRCFAVSDPDGYYVQVCKTVKQMAPEDIAAAASSGS
jgi:uncharacterized glyoxalase superfamily protein PhnB